MSRPFVCDECGKTHTTPWPSPLEWIQTHEEFLGGEMDRHFCSWKCLEQFAGKRARP